MPLLGLAIVLTVAGCGEKPSSSSTPDTGAREAVEAFFGGLIAGEPQRAYEVLDPDSKRRVSAEQFAALARAYAKNLGFAAEKVHIQSCEEQGDTATAHVSLAGQSVGHSRQFKDGVTLRRKDGRWGVVLPANFGYKPK
jgi:Putative lumazine-binding